MQQSCSEVVLVVWAFDVDADRLMIKFAGLSRDCRDLVTLASARALHSHNNVGLGLPRAPIISDAGGKPFPLWLERSSTVHFLNATRHHLSVRHRAPAESRRQEMNPSSSQSSSVISPSSVMYSAVNSSNR